MKNKSKTISLPPIKNNQSLISQKKLKQRANTQRIGDYINKSMKYIQSGCYQNGKLKIDGNIGDYRMSIFRLKDRNKRIKQNPTAFTSQFVKDINLNTPHLKQQLQRLIQQPNQKYLMKQKQEQQQVKHKPMKWQSQQQQHLLYQYIPKYQKQKWFVQTIDKSSTHIPCKLQLSQEKKYIKRTQRKTNNRKHIFRFLQINQKSF